MENLLHFSEDDVRGLVCKIVDKAIAYGDTGVSVTFMTNGNVYVNLYPYNSNNDDI